MRSLLPHHVRVMALTATATRKTREVVICRLSMQNPMVLSITPNKPNLIYRVVPKCSMEEVVHAVGDEILQKHTQASRTIIYCRYCKEVVEFYEEFRTYLGIHFTSPPGFLDMAKYRTVDMYMSVTANDVKDQIVKSFCDPCGMLRVVICTVAFGMGLDCPNVSHIVHWGPSTDLEGYVQETGRGGRDGQLCDCTILYHKSDRRNTVKVMLDYCENEHNCRRQELFKDFDDYTSLTLPESACKCCDICNKTCKCDECN